MLNIAFFWHMHQPYYRDPLTGEFSLPWVRLHALKGYYDMISLLEEYPAIHQTFNLVPSLLRQLSDYAREEGRDVFLEHTRKPAEELSPEEKKFILTNFFMCNWETMVKPYPEYWNLLLKRGVKLPEYRLDDLIHQFNSQDFRDLQVWFNLTWFGYRAREKKPAVGELLKKGRFFSEADKAALLRAQLETIQEVIPLYKSIRDRGQVEITISPFYHPILPLLINSAHASRAMPQVSLPGVFAHPEDAEAQIRKAIDYYRTLFGANPLGMWPSEGSVSPELIPIVQRAGIRWMASDEGILFKSLPGDASRRSLYQPYRVGCGESEVVMAFRDRNLSDLIGFTYSKNPPEASANDLVNHLRNIQKSLSRDRDPLVLIALDGENPWEYYPDGGRGFLSTLYSKLSHDTNLKTVRMDEFLGEHPPRETLNFLHSGSWIDQNFRIWIGSPEENRAWDCLKKTRSFLKTAAGKESAVPREKQQLAWEEIYIAEGSDWFWWFGDDFTSDNDEEFDRLFRMHLSNVYLFLGENVPDYLKTPIALAHEVKPTMEPLGFIAPALDGRITHFYEWPEAGYFNTRPLRSSMYRAEGFVSGIYYGFDLKNLYFRIDPLLRKQNNLEGLEFSIRLLTPREWIISFPVKYAAKEQPFFLLDGRPKSGSQTPRRLTSIASGSIIELAIPFADLEIHAKEKIEFFLQVQKGDLELERYPRSGYLSYITPDQEFQQINWQV